LEALGEKIKEFFWRHKTYMDLSGDATPEGTTKEACGQVNVLIKSAMSGEVGAINESLSMILAKVPNITIASEEWQ